RYPACSPVISPPLPSAPAEARHCPLMRSFTIYRYLTLIYTVYSHVFAWQRALAEAGLAIDGWKIHRRIGMSGGLFTRALAREIGEPLGDEDAGRIQARHGELFRELLPERRPLPGAVALLRWLREQNVPHGIATSGRHPEIDSSLAALGVPADMVVVDRGDVL